MLKQNNEKNLKQQKLHEAVLKHKVRNLRAKVQSLLPIHFCQKISKRNNRLKNQLMRKHQLHQNDSPHNHRTNYLHSHSQQKWKHTSGFNLNLKSLEGAQNFFQNNFLNQSVKTSIHQKTSCDCRQASEELFLDQDCDRMEFGRKKERSKQAQLKGYHFEKLTDDDIQQIDEDKLYYLGEERHIKAYDQFIKQKYTRKTTTPISNEVYKSVSRSTIAIGTYKNIRPVTTKQHTNTSLESENTLKSPGYMSQMSRQLRKTSFRQNNRSSKNQSFMNNSRGSSNNESRMLRNTVNDKLMAWNVNENLARINQEQQVKRILLSMELKTRQERVEENFYKIRKTKLHNIEQENLKEHIKILTAQQKKRKIYNQAGEIIDLTEKLRKKCIQRKTHKDKENQIDRVDFFYPEN